MPFIYRNEEQSKAHWTGCGRQWRGRRKRRGLASNSHTRRERLYYAQRVQKKNNLSVINVSTGSTACVYCVRLSSTMAPFQWNSGQYESYQIIAKTFPQDYAEDLQLLLTRSRSGTNKWLRSYNCVHSRQVVWIHEYRTHGEQHTQRFTHSHQGLASCSSVGA